MATLYDRLYERCTFVFQQMLIMSSFFFVLGFFVLLLIHNGDKKKESFSDALSPLELPRLPNLATLSEVPPIPAVKDLLADTLHTASETLLKKGKTHH